MSTDTAAGADARVAFREGVRDVVPVMVGIIPFALVAGAAPVAAGLGIEGALTLSTVVFAGASQLATIDLLARDAPLLVIVLTVAVINLRFSMYSAALAPLFSDESRPRRLLASYLLVDQPFALTVARSQRPVAADHHLAYYLGNCIPLWVDWVLMTAVGGLVGATIPDWLPLSATIPLVFLALLVPAMTDRPTIAAGVVSGVLATLFDGLPFNLGLLVGAASGIAAGTAVALRMAADGGVARGGAASAGEEST
jgi:predicted branched-subunit amino acid permease